MVFTSLTDNIVELIEHFICSQARYLPMYPGGEVDALVSLLKGTSSGLPSSLTYKPSATMKGIEQGCVLYGVLCTLPLFIMLLCVMLL